MTDDIDEPSSSEDAVAELRAKAEALERQLEEQRQKADARLIRAELRTEAVRAGMIDIDDLRLLDVSAARLTESDEVEEAADIIGRFKKAKPWLFNGNASSSSSSANVPPTKAPRRKLATEMNDSEYAAARAALLRQRY